MEKSEPFIRFPYVEMQPTFGSELNTELLADLVYTGIGQWPFWLKDILAEDGRIRTSTLPRFSPKPVLASTESNLSSRRLALIQVRRRRADP